VDIKNFKDVANGYRNLFFDIWGVIHDGIAAYKGTIDLINDLSKTHNVCFLSNAPRTSSMIADYLQEHFSIPTHHSRVMTSGAQTARYFDANRDALIYTMGERYIPEMHLPPVNFTKNIDEASHILCVAYHTDEDDLNQYDEILKKGVNRSIPLICANPDTAVIHGSGTRYCAGYFAQKYANFGGEVYLQGKPDINIYESLAAKIPNFKKEETLMIGDTFATDIYGADAYGIDSALVLTGNAGREIEKLQAQDAIDYDAAYNIFMNREKIRPTFVVHGVF
jgi:HAD superfamily hydrolase (TIGR01459 family)